MFNEQTTGAVFSLLHYGQFDSENGGFSCFLPKGKYLIEAIDPEGLHTSSWYGGIDSKSAKVVTGSANELILVMEKNLSFLILNLILMQIEPMPLLHFLKLGDFQMKIQVRLK